MIFPFFIHSNLCSTVCVCVCLYVLSCALCCVPFHMTRTLWIIYNKMFYIMFGVCVKCAFVVRHTYAASILSEQHHYVKSWSCFMSEYTKTHFFCVSMWVHEQSKWVTVTSSSGLILVMLYQYTFVAKKTHRVICCIFYSLRYILSSSIHIHTQKKSLIQSFYHQYALNTL